ncbi:hypothetical protein BC833DRAFT_571265 [Globomyces pollinis-pini]|nr:hypothetical protein BC833DRAFT_571265 [Globomyces pollinis-pini]
MAISHHQFNGYRFIRFSVDTPILKNESQVVFYQFDNASANYFTVPGENQPYKLCFSSCNGLPDDSPPEQTLHGIQPLWNDILKEHLVSPFHGQLGGGDQIYCDGVWRLPTLKEWLDINQKKVRLAAEYSKSMLDEVEQYYFKSYYNHFQTPNFKQALAMIPFNFTWDDHDIFDGWGSYPHELQQCPVFQGVYRAAERFYYTFQQHSNVELNKDEDIGVNSLSSVRYYGKELVVLTPDARSERTLKNVVSPESWLAMFTALDKIPSSVKNLIVNLTIPLAYPRLGGEQLFSFAGSVVSLTSKALKKFDSVSSVNSQESFENSIVYKKLLNEFGEPSLLDDLNDHWTNNYHIEERDMLVHELQNLSKTKSIRVSFLSGDVHLAAAYKFKSNAVLNIYPERDFRLMYQIVSSAIGNKPPPNMIVKQLEKSTKELQLDANTTELQHQCFFEDLNDKPMKGTAFLARRNWCCIWFPENRDLVFDLRLERVPWHPEGETKTYRIRIPELQLNASS